MPRKPSQERAKATVEAIVSAGFIAVGRDGLAGCTTRGIAEIAGVGIGSLYEYFTDKNQIFAAMGEQLAGDVVAMIRDSTPAAAQLDLRSMVLLLAKNFRELLERNDGRYLHCARHVVQMDLQKQLARIDKALLGMAMQFVMHHPELLRLQRLPAMSYLFIHGGVAAVVRHLSDPHPTISFDALAEGLALMVEHSLQGELRAAAA
ncbi:MAG TPA: TetR/AcrR family transcriptional regulator [Solimonas sp.]|nr:TetR/AcrR family transcriptional regulator [Solimonas sp.]